MIVQARDAQELARVKSVAQGLAVFAASGEDIARELGLKHYPVLIISGGIRQ